MTALAYTPERTLELKGFWSVISWISRRKASSRQCVMIPTKMLMAASRPGHRLTMRFFDDNGALVYIEDDMGIANGIIDELIEEGVSARQIPKEYRKRFAELQEGLDHHINEDSAWADENPNGTEEFLKQFLADAK